jgi:hypothetical protein
MTNLQEEHVMLSRYVYSINGEDYLGAYETRSTAESAAIKAARMLPDSPASVFVARSTLPDPRAEGFARLVLSHLRTQRESVGDGYLNHVSEDELRDLDSGIEAAVLGWLARHDRHPSVYRIEAVSEIPVPVELDTHAVAVGAEDEVYDLGVG